MRRLTVFLVAVLVLSLAAPALAVDAPSPPTDAPLRGDRINILHGTPGTYPEREAFHVWHAWSWTFSTLSEAQAVFADPDIRVEIDVDGVPVQLRSWNNVWEVDATCDSPRREAILERITRAKRMLRLADRWGCEASGEWVKGYFRNYPKGMTGTHSFEARAIEAGVPHPWLHTVVFIP